MSKKLTTKLLGDLPLFLLVLFGPMLLMGLMGTMNFFYLWFLVIGITWWFIATH